MIPGTVASELYSWTFALAVAFIPAVIYGYYLWSIERYNREPLRYVVIISAWGGLMACLFVFVTSLIFGEVLREQEYYAGNKGVTSILALTVAIPLLAEVMKMAGLPLVRTEIDEVEDGLVHGALCGLGFAAVANFIYLKNAFVADPAELAMISIPSLSFAYLHASAGAVSGYGVSRHYVEFENKHLLPYLIGGVIIHGGFIAFSMAGQSFKGASLAVYIGGLGVVLLLSWVVFRTIRSRMIRLIRDLDAETEAARTKGSG